MRPSGRLSFNGSNGSTHTPQQARISAMRTSASPERRGTSKSLAAGVHLGYCCGFRMLIDSSRQQLYRHSIARLQGDLRYQPSVTPVRRAWRLAVILRSIAAYGAPVVQVCLHAKGVPCYG